MNYYEARLRAAEDIDAEFIVWIRSILRMDNDENRLGVISDILTLADAYKAVKR